MFSQSPLHVRRLFSILDLVWVVLGIVLHNLFGSDSQIEQRLKMRRLRQFFRESDPMQPTTKLPILFGPAESSVMVASSTESTRYVNTSLLDSMKIQTAENLDAEKSRKAITGSRT